MTCLNLLRRRLLLVRELTIADWFALAEVWLGLFFFWAILRLRSAESLEVPSRSPASDSFADGALSEARRLHRLVELASRLYPRAMTCLPRALALRWMLGRRGIPADLQVGVQKSDSGIQAHAWIELGGQPVGESPDLLQRFSRLAVVKSGQRFN